MGPFTISAKAGLSGFDDLRVMLGTPELRIFRVISGCSPKSLTTSREPLKWGLLRGVSVNYCQPIPLRLTPANAPAQKRDP